MGQLKAGTGMMAENEFYLFFGQKVRNLFLRQQTAAVSSPLSVSFLASLASLRFNRCL